MGPGFIVICRVYGLVLEIFFIDGRYMVLCAIISTKGQTTSVLIERTGSPMFPGLVPRTLYCPIGY